MKALIPNMAIFSSSSTEMHLFVMHYGIKALENFCKTFLRFQCLLIMGITLELFYDLIKVGPKYFSVFRNCYILQIFPGSLDAGHFSLIFTCVVDLFLLVSTRVSNLRLYRFYEHTKIGCWVKK